MAFGQDLGNPFRILFGKRHISRFIDDQQVIADIPIYIPAGAFLIPGFYQVVFQLFAICSAYDILIVGICKNLITSVSLNFF